MHREGMIELTEIGYSYKAEKLIIVEMVSQWKLSCLSIKLDLTFNENGFVKMDGKDVTEKLILAESVSQWKERGAKSQKR